MPFSVVTDGTPTLYAMSDVQKWKGSNGLRMAGSFSGCGGSSIGYALAGFDQFYACEFDTHAAECYESAFPGVSVDRRSITDVTGSDIESDLDLWEGSPPCSKFSTAGNRESGWGQVSKSDQSDQKVSNVEDLFFEWTRLLGELRPRSAVAENVTGMLKGVSKGQAKLVLAQIRSLGYDVKIWKLNASDVGVPQIRRRIFFIAWDPSRCAEPTRPLLLNKYVSAESALADIELSDGTTDAQTTDFRAPMMLREDSHHWDRLRPGTKNSLLFSYGVASPTRPWPTLVCVENCSRTSGGPTHWERPSRKLSVVEMQRIASFPEDYPWPEGSTWAKIGIRLGNVVPPLMAFAVASSLKEALLR